MGDLPKNIERKPILTTSNGRNAENHPEFLDAEVLLERFDPLLRSIHKRFCSYDGVFNTIEDMNDLWNQIIYEFLRLRQNYDPRRGVDFPGYIKFHLQQRVYHYVTKVQKVSNNEQTIKDRVTDDEDLTLELENIPDESTEEKLERIEAISSIPWGKIKAQDPMKALFLHEVLVNRKSVEQVSKDNKIPIKTAQQLLEDCCEYLGQLFKDRNVSDDRI